jgi:hypothetical protein
LTVLYGCFSEFQAAPNQLSNQEQGTQNATIQPSNHPTIQPSKIIQWTGDLAAHRFG